VETWVSVESLYTRGIPRSRADTASRGPVALGMRPDQRKAHLYALFAARAQCLSHAPPLPAPDHPRRPAAPGATAYRECEELSADRSRAVLVWPGQVDGLSRARSVHAGHLAALRSPGPQAAKGGDPPALPDPRAAVLVVAHRVGSSGASRAGA
jgi:hypothetical protein